MIHFGNDGLDDNKLMKIKDSSTCRDSALPNAVRLAFIIETYINAYKIEVYSASEGINRNIEGLSITSIIYFCSELDIMRKFVSFLS
jgi:hypothetical protein